MSNVLHPNGMTPADRLTELGSLHFGDLDMEEADRVNLALLLEDLLTPGVGSASDAMALKSMMQR